MFSWQIDLQCTILGPLTEITISSWSNISPSPPWSSSEMNGAPLYWSRTPHWSTGLPSPWLTSQYGWVLPHSLLLPDILPILKPIHLFTSHVKQGWVSRRPAGMWPLGNSYVNTGNLLLLTCTEHRYWIMSCQALNVDPLTLLWLLSIKSVSLYHPKFPIDFGGKSWIKRILCQKKMQ